MKRTITIAAVALGLGAMTAAAGMGGFGNDFADRLGDRLGDRFGDRFGDGLGDRLGGIMKLCPQLAEFDLDEDGRLSEAEREALKEAVQEKLQAVRDDYDLNSDGVLDEDERDAAKEARMEARIAARTARFVDLAGDDGELSVEELQAAIPRASEERTQKVFDRFDADEDGVVTLDEFLNPTRPDPKPERRWRSRWWPRQRG